MPISLVESVYKIIVKILSNRLEKVIHKIIDQKQYALLKEEAYS